jgi:hypothetical protein
MTDIDEFKKKYLSRLDEEFDQGHEEVTTREYQEFKDEYLPQHLTWYEKVCKASGNLLQVSPGDDEADKLRKNLEVTHLDITPTDALSFALLAPLAFILVMSVVGYGLPLLVSPGATTGSLFLVFFAIIAGLVMIYPLKKLPYFFANYWRMKASTQMVLCIFYIVTFMRHTSNLERAIDFAAEHLDPPLSLDLKKVLWNIEMRRHSTLKESLDEYLETWRDWNREFIESMHLIESSLYENSESRRRDALDKALDVMLQETYEKMLHYAHNLKGPLQALHMLGIVLPILGLVILPLMVSFLPSVQWYHIMVLYNIALPIGVYYMGKNILSRRPTGYGQTQMMAGQDRNYDQARFEILGAEFSMNPWTLATTVLLLFLLIGISPLLLHLFNPSWDVVMTSRGVTTIDAYQNENAMFYFLGYRPVVQDGEQTDQVAGPFGIGATLLSLMIPLALGVGIGLRYRLGTRDVMKIREKSKELEEEFAGALFQLGNRLGDGLPAEIAFQKVATVMDDTVSGKFFNLVSINISRLGMGLEKAIFDPEKGALSYYPSNLIESSMKVLVQASKKGPSVASQALMNVSEYIKQMHRVDERLRDLMADIVSDMKSQISFLTPAIAGIVVGITSMITKILGSLGENISQLETDAASQAGAGGFGGALLGLFGTGIPTYWFQAIVGVYVVQVVFVLTVMVNGIQNGSDDVMKRSMLGKYLMRTTLTYVAIAAVVMVIFNFIGGAIVGPMTGG